MASEVKPLGWSKGNIMHRLTFGVREAAEMIGLSHWTLRQYIREGKIRPVRIGRRILIEPAELDRLVAQGRK